MTDHLEAARAAVAKYEAEPDADPKIVADFHLRLDSADREELSRRGVAKYRKTQQEATAATLKYGDVLAGAVETMAATLDKMVPAEPADMGKLLCYGILREGTGTRKTAEMWEPVWMDPADAAKAVVLHTDRVVEIREVPGE